MSRTTILLKSRTMTSTRSSAEMSSPRSVSTSSVLCFGSIFSYGGNFDSTRRTVNSSVSVLK